MLDMSAQVRCVRYLGTGPMCEYVSTGLMCEMRHTAKAASAQVSSHSRQGFWAKRPAVRLSRTTATMVLHTAQHGTAHDT
jgi:hypothetical protein